MLLVAFSYQDCESSREGEGEGKKFLRRRSIAGGWVVREGKKKDGRAQKVRDGPKRKMAARVKSGG